MDGNFLSDEKVTNYLNNLGLSRYEAKIYLALLRHNLSYGSEIQKVSGVPGPKVYETLSGLIEKGLVYPEGNNPVRYQPLPLGDFIKIKEKEFNRITDYLSEFRDKIVEKKEPDWLWHLKGYNNLIDKAKETIDLAQKTIYLSFWEEDGRKLTNELDAALQRGVKIVSIQMGDETISVGKVFKHIMLPVVHEVHGKELIVVSDRIHGMFMVRSEEDGVEGYYSSSQGISQLIENYVRHDIFINRAINDFKEEMLSKYGPLLEGLLIL